ncbi:hypothetical protein [Cellulosilyticum ruminicola]|uniref:hypothetical protein n=1 Tax=Cellulosilyticum ruminicola TaxID=425254 RepID=UPI0006D11D12|nr:hypothetical protein [Cellulosilyticum ruminicola]
MKDDYLRICAPYMLFKADGAFFVYDGGNGVVHQISNVIYDILSIYEEKDIAYSIQQIEDKLSYKYDISVIGKAFQGLKIRNDKGLLSRKGEIYKVYEAELRRDKENFFKGSLWLNLVHDCNLRCRYCYASGGSYGEERRIMSKETAKKCIDYWYQRIDKSDKKFSVAFLGGSLL